MDESMLLNGVLRSVLGGRRKRSRGAMGYLGNSRSPFGGTLGSIGGSLLSNPNLLLTAAGVAWGIFETLEQGNTPAAAAAAASPVSNATQTPPLPPLPVVGNPSAMSDQALQVVRLSISAAYADGSVSDQERAAILDQARIAGVDRIVEQELVQPRPLAEIVAGVNDDTYRGTLYVLAFGILRGDEQPTGAERIYLAKLAHLLGLDPGTVQQLERNAAKRIDAETEQ
ncbi:MAG TPA: DUF533 domain-containing protein [Vicinamibacterales bacterium]|nr:DUF533 domain-containing protein [Vicinamibacterales bacterium]